MHAHNLAERQLHLINVSTWSNNQAWQSRGYQVCESTRGWYQELVSIGWNNAVAVD